MAKIYYVNLNNSYLEGFPHIGSPNDPFNFGQFLNSLSGEYDPEYKEYYLSGARIMSASSDFDIKVGNSPIIALNSWDSRTPWMISFSAGTFFNGLYWTTYGLNIDLNTSSTTIDTSEFIIYDGILESLCGFLNIHNHHTNTKKFYAEDIHYRVDSYLEMRGFYQQDIINSTLAVSGSLHVSPDNVVGPHFCANFINNIIGNDMISYYFPSSSKTLRINLSNDVLSSRTIFAPLNYTNSQIISANCQTGWTQPTNFYTSLRGMQTSAITSALNYINSNYRTITVSGNRDYVYRTMWDGRRDGIGALYFPQMPVVALSAVDQLNYLVSAAINTPVIYKWPDIFGTYSATSANLYLGDGNTLNIYSGTSASHTYITTIDGAYVSMYVDSHNQWYSHYLGELLLYIYPSGSVSANIYVLDYPATKIITSANIYDNCTVSAVVVQGQAYSYVINFDDGTSASYSEAEFSAINYAPKSYSTGGKKDIKILFNDESIFSATLYVMTTSGREFYVDITSAYDVNLNNAGTVLDPFNYSEFVSMVSLSGLARRGDIFRLKGNRTLVKPSSASDLQDYYVLCVDKTKGLVIRDWDVRTYGPWIFKVDDFANSTSYNSVICFEGCELRNGIIYNKPIGVPKKGGKIKITKVYDTWIVNQGQGCSVVISPYFPEQNLVLTSAIGTTNINIIVSGISAINGTSSTAPTDVFMPTYIYDDFASSGASTFWDNDFRSDWKVSAYPPASNNYVMVRGSNGQDRLTSGSISGDFIFEFGVIIGANTGGENVSIHMTLMSGASVDICDFLWAYNNISWNWPTYTNRDNYGYILSTYDELKLRYYRQNGIVSAQYYNGSNWVTMAQPFSYGGSVTIELDGADKNGISYLHLQASGGLPIYLSAMSGVSGTSGISAVSAISAVNSLLFTYYEETINISAESDIYGSTIYADSGFITDFVSGTSGGYTDSTNTVKFSVYDSVINKLSADSSYKPVLKLYMSNSLIGISASQVSGYGFDIMLDENNLYNWGFPSNVDYPFHVENQMHNMNYIEVFDNKAMLKPFSGIPYPPNPGKHYPTYPKYETGLFGYSRKDYRPS